MNTQKKNNNRKRKKDRWKIKRSCCFFVVVVVYSLHFTFASLTCSSPRLWVLVDQSFGTQSSIYLITFIISSVIIPDAFLTSNSILAQRESHAIPDEREWTVMKKTGQPDIKNVFIFQRGE